MSLKVRTRKDRPGLWIVGTVRGRRIRKSAGTDDPGLADEFRAAEETRLYRAAVYGERAQVGFAAAVDAYLNDTPAGPGTLRRLLRLVRQLGPKTMCDEVDQGRLDQVAAALLRPGYAPATKLREIVTPARSVLRFAAVRKWCAAPIFAQTRQAPGRTEWLSPAEVDRLIGAAASHLRPVLEFLFATGARLSEALDLDWRDVDLRHARAVLRATKNGTDRIVELRPRTIAVLAALLHREGRVFRPRYSGGRIGTAYRDNHRLAGGQIRTAWRGAMRRAGIERHATPHTARHTFASWHYALHRDLLLLKRAGGWKSASQVERYAHLAPAGMAPEIEAWLGIGGPMAVVVGAIG